MKKPFLFNTVDFLYNKVMKHAPKSLQERSIGSAFVLGYSGNYLSIDGIQIFSKMFMPQEFDQYILPVLEGICVAATVTAPLVYSFIKPKEIETTIKEHPTYSSGMIGAGFGAITSVFTGLENLF